MENVLMVIFSLLTSPIFIFIPLYIFYPKGLAKVFNSLAGMDVIPEKRINKFILYGLLYFVAVALSMAIMCGIFALIKEIDYELGMSLLSNDIVPSIAIIAGFALYFVMFYFIEKKKGFPLKVVIFEAYYSYLLMLTLAGVGVLLFYLGIIFLFIGLAVLILFMCLGGVGDKVNVSSGDLLNSTTDTLTRGLDGEWRDSHGTAYDKHGDEWRPK